MKSQLSSVERVIASTPEDGEYSGHWHGRSVSFSVGGKLYRAKSFETRIVDGKCTVVVVDGLCTAVPNSNEIEHVIYKC